jgi:hypothetical protein
MSSRAILCIALLTIAVPAEAQDWSDFARASDRSQDGFLLQIMNEGDLATAAGICASVGQRADPYAGDIIASIAASHIGREITSSELLLRTLLKGLLDPERAMPPLADRISVNREGLLILYDSISTFRDPQLVSTLVELLPSLPDISPKVRLAAAGRRVLDSLAMGNGMLNAPETALAMSVLAVARQLGGADFLDFCAAIVHLSRDPDLLRAARSGAAALASAPTR